MRLTRRKLRFAVLICVAAVATAVFLLHTKEPRYAGRPLSYWLAQYRPSTGQYGSAAEAQEAETAVRAIGTNAIPFLVGWLRFEPGAVKEWISRNVARLPDKIFRSRYVQEKVINSTPDLWSERATEGFKILGPAGAPAIPELMRLVNAPNTDFSAARSLYALGHIGKAAFPEFVTLIQDSRHPQRARAIDIVGYMSEWGVDVSSLRPVLLPCLYDTNAFVRAAATNALREVDREVLTGQP